jgi:glycosyltransferase involved in cell wall biosynthesis
MTTAPFPLPAGPRPAPARLAGLSVVLPCFNEEASVAAAIRDGRAAAALWSEDYEIIVVDDGSTDATARVAGEFVGADPHVRLIVHTVNRGYGAALRSGIEAARMEWVLLADADGQFDMAELADFVLLTDSADVVWGRRIVRRDRLRRRAAAAGWNRLVRTLFHLPVRDVDCGFKLIRRDLLGGTALHANGAMISTELLVRCLAEGARVAEIGVHHHPRRAGRETGGDPHVIARAFRELAIAYPGLRRLWHAPVS